MNRLDIKKKCICLICRSPDTYLLDFYSKFKNYDVYCIVDNNSLTNLVNQYKEEFPKIQFIQYQSDILEEKGYTSTTSIGYIIGYDKLLYHFSEIDKKYDYVWALEDDVYIYSENTLMNIDDKYETADLLCEAFLDTGVKDISVYKGSIKWHSFDRHHFSQPWYKSMVCAARLSKEFLNHISEYAKKYGNLYFHEYLFPTLAYYNNLEMRIPPELSTVHWRYVDQNGKHLENWPKEKITANNIYHPVKRTDLHNEYREYTQLIK